MKKRLAVVTAVVLTLALLLTSCGQKRQNTEAVVNSIEKAQDVSKMPADAKNRKDTLIVGTTAPSGKFVPVYSDSVYDSWISGLVHESMISNNAAGEPIPNIATWKVSDDQKTYTFTLKDGVKFSNGTPVKASDVEFTFLAIADPNYDGPRMDAVMGLVGYKEYNEDKDGKVLKMKGIEVVDDKTIKFTTADIKATAIWDFGYGIMSKDYYGFKKGDIKALKDKFLTPMGAGPYKLKSYKPGQEVVFEKNKDYWQGDPKIANIILKVTNANTVIQELTTGGVDIDKIPTKIENVNLLKQAGFLDIQSYMANSYGYIGWNLRNPMFSDKKVRQALTIGFNREGFINAYYKGLGNVCQFPASPVSWAKPEKFNEYKYDKAKAEQMLEEAGWKKESDGWRYKDGKRFTVHFLTYTGSKYVETLVPLLMESWKAIGVELINEQMEFATVSERAYDKQDFEMYTMAWSLSIDPDPSGIFDKAQAELGGFNSVGWINDKSQELMEKGLKTTNIDERKKIYSEWLTLANEELPYMFLNQSKDIYGVSSRVKGISLSPYRDWTYDVWKAELVDPTAK